MKLNDLLKLGSNVRSYSVDEKRRQTKEATGGATRDPNSTRVRIATPKIGSGAAGQMEESPVSLVEIGRAYHSDSYIRRAVDKVVGLMFKSGWQFVSLNEDALNYVETRFRLMEESTGQSTEELLREGGMNFVLYANAPFVKTRGSENLANLTATGYYGGEPISGIFNVSPEYFGVQRDDFGNVETYSVTSDGGGGEGVEFPPEDFSHLTYHKPTGRAYGVPYINNVIDDVLILRQIEENIARLVYRNIFPLQTYTVGRVEPGYEATDEEIDEVTEMIQNAPLDSIIVMPERHKIDTVSSNSGALDAYNYLRYFRQRVFTGLGVSESTMGIGDSSNRSTSDNQSSDLLDLVKDFQQNFASEFQNLVNEILFEGGFDPTLNKEDRVDFTFTEIEQAAKIARENHEMQKFMMNVQGLDQTRSNIGYEPAEDLSRYYINLFGTSSFSSESAEGSVDSKDQPENQAGKQDAPNKDTMKASLIRQQVKESANTLLTDAPGKVNLHSDDAKGLATEQLLQSNWLAIKDHLWRHKEQFSEPSFSIEELIQQGLSNKLFVSQEDKAAFSKQLAPSIRVHLLALEKEGLSSERYASLFYKYEEAVKVRYENFLFQHQQGGGK